MRDHLGMRRWLSSVLLAVGLGGLLLGVATYFLSWPGWLFEDDSQTRNVVEGLSWVFTIGSPVVSGIVGMLRKYLSKARTTLTPEAPGTNPLRGRALHLVRGHLPTAVEVGLLDAGVSPAVDTDTDAEMPPFVPRDRNDDLEWAIARGGMVLVHGQAAAGKSRTAIEAIRRSRPNHRMLIPCDGPALRELATSKLDFERVVVWLDDFERFLVQGGFDLGVLHRLCPSGSMTTIVAMIRDEQLARYDHAAVTALEGEHSLDRNAVELIEQVQGRRRIKIERRLTDNERQKAVKLPDPRIKEALKAEEGFAENLAAGRAMLGRWSIGGGDLFHVGQALISAAVDCRRAGYHRPLSTSTLDGLSKNYLAPGWRSRSDLPSTSEGLAWAKRKLFGANSCLQPRVNGENEEYVAADYLVDSVTSAESPLSGEEVHPEVWDAVLILADDEEGFDIGVTAYLAANNAIAVKGFLVAAEAGNSKAMYNLGVLFRERGDVEEAESWYRQAAEAGQSMAMANLGNLRLARGDVEEAENWFRQAAEAGENGAMINLGALLDERGDVEEAEGWYRQAVEAGDRRAMINLGSLFRERGDVEEAESWYRQAAEAGQSMAMGNLGNLLRARGDVEEAESWYRRGAETSAGAMIDLGNLLRERGDVEEAEGWYRQAVEAGDSRAMVNLGVVIDERGDVEEAESWYRQAIDAGESMAMANLGNLLRARGDVEEAESWYRRGAETGDMGAMVNLSNLLDERGDIEEAESWWQRAVET